MADSNQNPELARALDPGALRKRSPSGATGLVHVPLPAGGLPLSSVDEAVEAVLASLPLDEEGQRTLRALTGSLGFGDLPVPALHELDGLVLSSLAFAPAGGATLFIGLAWPDADWQIVEGFGIAAPALSVAVTAGHPRITVDGILRFGALSFDCEVVLPGLELSAHLAEPANLGQILSELHLDGSSLDELELTRADLDVSVPDKSIAFAMAVDGDWHPFGSGRGPALRHLEFEIDWSKDGGGVSGSFAAELALTESVIFDAWGAHTGVGWELGATLRIGDGGLSLTHLVEEALEAFGLPSAELPFEANLTEAGVTLSTASGDFSLHSLVEIGDARVTLELSVARDAAGARELSVGGSVQAGGIELDLLYRGGSFLCAFSEPEGRKLDLSTLCTELLELLGVDADDVPTLPEVDLSVKEVLLVALGPEPSPPSSDSGSRKVDVSDPASRPKRRFLLFVDLDLGFHVGALPLVGDIFGSDFELKVRFAPRYASAALETDDLRRINGLLPAGVAALPEASVAKGASFDAQVSLGSLALPLPLDMSRDEATNAAQQVALEPRDTAAAPPAPPDNTSWVQLDKTIGPLTLARLGLGRDGNDIRLVLDGGVALGPVQAAALGLGVSYDLRTRHLTPQLDGLAIAFSAGAVSIAGGFLRTRSTSPDLGDCYAGLLRIVASELQLSVLGLYQEAFGGPTFFLYGFVGFSVGLRPLITVDGIALGFGYGRRLIPVPLHQIHDFPLVREVVGDASPPAPGLSGGNAALAVLDELRDLQTFLPAARGGLVFAVGLKVGLLESLVDGFVLATVSISLDDPADLLIQIFGAATAELPPKTPQGPLVARLELDIVARIRPLQGELLIGLDIGKGSYVLDPNAALTGGIALGVWMAGPHAGDFVLTAGGYPAAYKRPAHYPIVPRLGLHWQVSDAVSIKGELYGAVTPSAFMAGGLMQADFRAGKVHAWFKLSMDVLIQWKPFHYDFTAGVSIGASYGSLGISAHADLHVWGPPFAGKAHISVSVVLFSVSFDVEFGAIGAATPALAWTEFRASFLPPAGKVCVPTVAAGVFDLLEGDRAAGTHSGSDAKHWVVDPGALLLTVESAVPWSADGELAIHPMRHQETKARLTTSRPEVTLIRDDVPVRLADVFDTRPRTKRFATALWRLDGHTDESIDLEARWELTPKPAPAPTVSREIQESALEFTGYEVRAEALPPPTSLGAPNLSDDGPGPETIDAALSDAATAVRRRAALAALGLDTRAHGIRDDRPDLTTRPRLTRRAP